MKSKKEIIYIVTLIIIIISIISLITLKVLSGKQEDRPNINDQVYNVWSYSSTEYYLNGELYDKVKVPNSSYVMTISKEKVEYCFFDQHNERICTAHDYEIDKENITIYNDEALPAKYNYQLLENSILELKYIDEEYAIVNYYQISLG